MQNTSKRCVILLVFIILRWSFNYESNVFRFNKILIDCVFGNSKFVVPSTLTIDLGFASVNSQCLRDNKLAIPSYSVNKYILWSSFTRHNDEKSEKKIKENCFKSVKVFKGNCYLNSMIFSLILNLPIKRPSVQKMLQL
jgi:hypothetical protein